MEPEMETDAGFRALRAERRRVKELAAELRETREDLARTGVLLELARVDLARIASADGDGLVARALEVTA